MTTIANEIELEPLPSVPPGPGSVVTSVLPFLGSVMVRAVVRVGAAKISVADLCALKDGTVLALDRLVDQPMDVLVHEHIVARGTLVAVGDSFGVRITEVAVTPDVSGDIAPSGSVA
jgi:flagellar motor switch protein FliN